MDSNIKIVERLLELVKNGLEYSLRPKGYMTEHMFLANVLNDSLHRMELEFKDKFRNVVAEYKRNLSKGEYGWFHKYDDLEWLNTYMNQVKYAVYGKDYIREIKFDDSLGKDAYRDFICQIDRTALMSPEELKAHNEELERISAEVVEEILKESKHKNK